VLEAARLAPSASNIQPWQFIVVTDSENRKKISALCPFGWFLADSPVVIVACGDCVISPRYYVIDTTIALEQMVLAATAEGLGTCWIGSFNEEAIEKLLEIPDRLKIVALLSLGYPIETPSPRPRKQLDEIVHYERYGLKVRSSS
jgi:nitroreductase